MKYPTVIVLILTQTVAFSQKSDCLLSKVQVVKSGVLTYEQINSYDVKKQLINKEERFLDESLIKYTKTNRFVYDKNGNITENALLLNDAAEKTIFRKFSSENQLLEEAILLKDGSKTNLAKTVTGNNTKNFNPDGTFTNTVSVKDVSGRITKETVFDVKGNASSVTEFLYDSKGELLKKIFVETPRKRTTETAFERNENGEILAETVKINAEPFSRKIYELNDIGKVTKIAAFNRYNTLDYELIYTFNESGNVTSESYFYNKELITKKENSYDKNGNLVRVNNFERGKLISSEISEYRCP
ncbi:MAG: hypothetical protein NWQ46_09130 [Spirosomaceae bacterium]|nr:hypothetical protein [Spirosomataceae bacterium]